MKEIILLLLAFPLTGALLWLAWKRPNQRQRATRMLATGVAAGSLVLMTLAPQRTVTETPGAAILLTPGFHPDTLEALLRRLPARPLRLSYRQAAPGYRSLSAMAELRQIYPQVKRLHVLGFGLDAGALKMLGPVRLFPHLSALPAGVTDVTWQKELVLGEELALTGRIHQPEDQDTRIYLKAADRVLDSVRVQIKGHHRFTLRYTPRQEGRMVYTLATKTGATVREAGLVPVQLQPPPVWRILLLPSAPGFEFKFLKNYLAGSQHAVAARIPISQDIYQTEFLNRAPVNLNRLRPELLRRFNLVITDTRMLQGLAPAENRALTQAITGAGLGLLVLPSSGEQVGLPRVPASFTLSGASLKDSARTNIFWAGRPDPVPAAVLPLVIRPGEKIKKLVWSAQGILAACQPQGWGTVAVSLLPQTYSWALAGQQNRYAAFWAHLLGQVVRPTVADHQWQIPEPLLAKTHQPVTLELSDYLAEDPPVLPQVQLTTGDEKTIPVPLQQDPYLKHRFTGTFWPRQAGWHQVRKESNPGHLFYIYPDSSWQAVAQSHTLTQTRSFVQKQRPPGTKTEPFSRKEPIPSAWFFLSFLVSAGILWIEEKL